jgi:murein L,D-transpeptidase YcbB/YkuD
MIKKLLIIFLFAALGCSKKEHKALVPIKEIPVTVVTKEGKIIALDSAQLASREPEIRHFYENNDLKTYWISSPEREELLVFLNHIEEEGLSKKDFDIEKINAFEQKMVSFTDAELVEYEMLLAENVLRFVKLGSSGKLDAKKLYPDWDLKPNSIDYNALLLNFLKKDSIHDAFKKVTPSHIVYHSLKKALKIINALPKDNFTTIAIEDKIVANDTNPKLIDIKKRLIYWKDLKAQDSLTPIYDEATVKAVKRFQSRHGLAADGVIGKGTVTTLNVAKAQREKQIIANMERWRWFPRNLEENYVIINIPDYVLHTVTNSDTTRTHFVIVGTNKRKTPILSSKLSHAVFNPTWTVPPTILKEDIIPAATRNRGYFASKNITIYNSAGESVSAYDWNPGKANSYRYVQSPGSFNSLGMVKVIFPNRFSVYLHDTNHRDYFTKTNRSLSSGCVRVQNAIEFAEYLIADSDKWNPEKITEVLLNGKTTNVNFKKETYIHQLYWTAWSENNTLQFRNDIYNLDFDLYDKLRN